MNQESLNILKQKITDRAQSLLSTAAFSNWFNEQSTSNGDIVVINNSFIYRKPLIKTSKNQQYLCVKVNNQRANPAEVFVTTPGDFNSDFKMLSVKKSDLPLLEPLDEGVKREMKYLGQLVFVLIGELEDIPASVTVNHSVVKELKYDPTAKNDTVIDKPESSKKVIVVRQLIDPESAWNAVKAQLEQELDNNLSSLEAAFAVAFEKLQDEARLRLCLPEPNTSRTNTTFIDRLRESVSEQRSLYETALEQYASSSSADDVHLRDAMRIAYNFSDDAIKVLRLLVSVTDLKGVLLWCTIKEHFDVAEAFRNLPWTKSRKKPSLESYKEIIGGARNRAFHNLLAFDRTIEADLAGVKVNARRLTLLPSYSHRKSNIPFDYEDREMVEVLAELTRAQEVAVPLDFWKKNVAVMETFEQLLENTEDALWTLNSAYITGQ